jgi:hypothetical protein
MPKKTYPQNWFFQNSTSLCCSLVSRHAHQCLGCGDSITLKASRKHAEAPCYLVILFFDLRASASVVYRASGFRTVGLRAESFPVLPLTSRVYNEAVTGIFPPCREATVPCSIPVTDSIVVSALRPRLDLVLPQKFNARQG